MKKYLSLLAVILGLGSVVPAQAPADWTVNPADYEHRMTVTAILKVNDQIAGESNNVIAAFVGSECRGTATPMLTGGRQMYFLMIYGNTNGETITFKTYYSPLDTVLINTNSLLFDGNAYYGTPDNPYELKATYTIVGITPEKDKFVESFVLHQNYPNPFNASTTIRYEVPRSGRVVLKVFDLQGNCIEELVNDYRDAGIHQLQWKAQRLSSGVYYYLLHTSDQVLKRRCIYMK